MSFRKTLDAKLEKYYNDKFSHVLKSFEKTLMDVSEKGLQKGSGFVLLSETPLTIDEATALRHSISHWTTQNCVNLRYIYHMEFTQACRLDCHYEVSLAPFKTG